MIRIPLVTTRCPVLLNTGWLRATTQELQAADPGLDREALRNGSHQQMFGVNMIVTHREQRTDPDGRVTESVTLTFQDIAPPVT